MSSLEVGDENNSATQVSHDDYDDDDDDDDDDDETRADIYLPSEFAVEVKPSLKKTSTTILLETLKNLIPL